MAVPSPAVCFPTSSPSVQNGATSLSGGQPNVSGILSTSTGLDAESERKHIIGNRKPAAKKSAVSCVL